MKIAIPSAFRADKRARSLEQLLPLQGALEEVTWWVPEEQAKEYDAFLPRWMNVAAVRNSTTVNVARNAIHEFYHGEDVVVMEDDVPWYVGSREVWDPSITGGPPSSPRLNVLEVGTMGFAALNATGLSAWGIYPVAYSGLALKPRLGVGCLFLVGHTVGLRLKEPSVPELWLPIKEDYELSAMYVQAHGAVVRLDAVCAYSISGKGTGGTNTYRNPQQEAKAADYLLSEWPEMFTAKANDRNGLKQIAMKGDVQWTTLNPVKGWKPYVKG